MAFVARSICAFIACIRDALLLVLVFVKFRLLLIGLCQSFEEPGAGYRVKWEPSLRWGPLPGALVCLEDVMRTSRACTFHAGTDALEVAEVAGNCGNPE